MGIDYKKLRKDYEAETGLEFRRSPIKPLEAIPFRDLLLVIAICIAPLIIIALAVFLIFR